LRLSSVPPSLGRFVLSTWAAFLIRSLLSAQRKKPQITVQILKNNSNYVGTVRFCFCNKTQTLALRSDGMCEYQARSQSEKKMSSRELIHSINNQLTILIGRADLLSQAEVSAETQRACLELKAAAGKLNRLIREYMDKSLAHKAN
jgi:hypothetical protein